MDEWRYLPHGRVTHAIAPWMDGVARCGVATAPDEWRGTGTQDEYERAEQLPRCRRCVSILGGSDG